MPLTSGQSLSFYEVLGPLGAGAMGEVYRARDTRLARRPGPGSAAGKRSSCGPPPFRGRG